MKAQPLTVFLPDTRGVELSRFGKGNLKIGLNVHTYSRLPGRPQLRALGYCSSRKPISATCEPFSNYYPQGYAHGTCPGSTPECEAVCYAKRITGPVRENYLRNTDTDDVPPLPEDCRLLRLHVSGDFDTVAYIEAWVARLIERPDVTCWAYTRSWRVPSLLPFLEDLRALPNVQMFASMDVSTKELPPAGWRRAWLNGDPRECAGGMRSANENSITLDGTPSYVCPEETGRKPNCEACGYCFAGRKHDVTFLLHTGDEEKEAA